MNVQVSLDTHGYALTFNNPKHAAVMYEEIRLGIANGGGVAQDLTPEEIKQAEVQRHAAEVAAKQEAEAQAEAQADRAAESQARAEERAAGEVNVSSENQEGGITAGEVNVHGIADAAAAAVEADGYDADPEMYNNQYTCSNCECEYTFECADPDFEIACPDCDTSNKPDSLLA